jgi:ribosomal protein S18 acetylase RimI-like enzyme
MTIRISEFAHKNLQDIVRLLDEEYVGSFEFIPFSEERILSQIRRRDLKVLVAEENGKVLGLIGTYLEERAEMSISWLAVHDGSNRMSIENMLIDEVERRAKGGSISTTVDEWSPRTRDWIGRGYTLNPGWLRMSVKLDGLKPIPEVAEGIKLRGLRPAEEEKLIGVMNSGFGWQRLEAGVLEKWKSEDPPFSEEWVQVAEINQRLVSAVVARPDTDYLKYLHIKRGYLGPAATLSEFRNKGLASALTAQAMNFLFNEGMDSVRLGTSEQNYSSINLLRGLGFHVDIIRKILRKKLEDVQAKSSH